MGELADSSAEGLASIPAPLRAELDAATAELQRRGLSRPYRTIAYFVEMWENLARDLETTPESCSG